MKTTSEITWTDFADRMFRNVKRFSETLQITYIWFTTALIKVKIINREVPRNLDNLMLYMSLYSEKLEFFT